MRKLLLASLVLSLGIFFFSSNTNSTDILYWNPDYRLTWNDFAGYPAVHQDHISAMTASGIVHYKGCNDGFINYKVQAYFERKESWVKVEALTDHHLTHEQIHFDITELYARKLRKALSERKFKCGEENQFEKFIAGYTDEWQRAQSDYDLETEHSLKPKEQEEWYHNINHELSQLEEYIEVAE